MRGACDLRAPSDETYRTAEWQRAHLGPVLAGSRRRGQPYDRPYDVAAEGERQTTERVMASDGQPRILQSGARLRGSLG